MSKIGEKTVIKTVNTAASGVALGGIGAGSVEIRADGRLYCWNFPNSQPWTKLNAHSGGNENHCFPPTQPAVMDADFMIRVKEKGKRPVYRWLFAGNGFSIVTASHFFRHHKYYFIKSFESVEYNAEFPFVHLKYVDSEFPVEVKLKAWSSFIPRDVKNSALPGCYFDFTAVNKTERDLNVSIIWQQQNLAGYACEKNIQRHEKKRAAGAHMVKMCGSLAEKEHDSSGDMTIWAKPAKGQKASSIAANPYMQNIIWSIHNSGGLDGKLMPEHISREELNEEPQRGVPNKGWLCLQDKLRGKKTTAFKFGLSWSFPNYRSVRGTFCGHMYSNWFKDSSESAAYLCRGHDSLEKRSGLMPELLLNSDMPRKVALSILDQLSTLYKSTQYIKNGRFGLQEGHGCCAFNTVDVDHYSSFGLATLFPELRKQVLVQQNELVHPDNGKIHHGLPRTLEKIPGGGGANSGYSRWDCCAQYTLQVYRDCKWSGDTAMMKKCYPHAKRAMSLLADMDFYKVGLPYIQGGITYDHWNMVGVVGYMAGVYIAGMKALEDMARVCGDEKTAEWAAGKAEAGVRGFERYLYNGKQYLLFYARRPKGWNPGDDVKGEHKIFDAVKPDRACIPGEACGDDGKDECCMREPAYIELEDTGMMTDLLNGNAMTAVLGLGQFLKKSRVKKQLKMILERNVQEECEALVNGTYPDEHFLDGWPFMQWQTPWTGTEYFFALQCYESGMVKEGDRIISMVFDRHSREGMRWDHSECSNHYARPLSIWGAYAARHGVRYDGYRDSLLVESPAKGYCGGLVLANAMGKMEYNAKGKKPGFELNLLDGNLKLARISVKLECARKKCELKINGKTPAHKFEKCGKYARFKLDKPFVLKKGDILKVKVKG